jgi:hypothetical protein
MTNRFAMTVLLLSACAWSAAAADDIKDHPPATKNARFDQFKQIIGTWEGKEMEGRPGTIVTAEYRLTSGGTAIEEKLFANTPMEMVTIIHCDGDDLLLTHYCMLGNQPRMKASGSGESNRFDFKFVGATNLKSPTDMHMHDVSYSFPDKDKLKSEWTHYHDGKSAGQVVFELKRKK